MSVTQFCQILIASVAAIAVLVLISQRPLQNTPNPHEQAYAENSGSAHAPIANEQQAANQAQHKSADLGDQRPPEAGKTWALSDKIAAIAMGAAILQFVALAITIIVMIVVAQRQLRAYVNVEESSLINFEAEVPIVQVSVRNFGATPARNVRTLLIVRAQFPADRPLPELDPSDEKFRGVLAPRGHFILLWRLDDPKIPDARKERVTAGEAAIYAFGKITYRDVFGLSHWTTFRVAYGGEHGIHPAGNMATCVDGNDAT